MSKDNNPSAFHLSKNFFFFLVFKAFSPLFFITSIISSRFVGEVISETARSRQY